MPAPSPDPAFPPAFDPARGPLDRRRPRLILAGALATVVVVGTLGASHWQGSARPQDALGMALALVGPVIVALRPRPVPAVLIAVAAIGAYLGLGYTWGPALGGTVGVLVTVLLTGPAAQARVLAWAGSALMWGVVAAAATLRDDAARSAGLLAGAAWTTVALLGAGAVRNRFARAAAARAARLERERTAVATERLRIARELHDVLAHSLSAITVQAGVGLHLLDRDLEQARSSLASIRTTSRDALDEVRAVLGVVRGEADAQDGGARAPTWDLAGVPLLAGPLRAEGVDVRLHLPDDATNLPAHVAGVAYRVVQESLTNVGRHAAATRVVVRLSRATGSDGPELRVHVVDDGGPGTPVGDAAGYGLRGMRERVEGSGGTLYAGPGDDGPRPRDADPEGIGAGFLVDARIPLTARAGTGPGAPVARRSQIEEDT